MKKFLFLSLIFFLAIPCFGTGISRDTLVTPNPSKEAVALYRYLQDMFGKKILAGQMWVPWGNDGFTYIKTITGKQPAIMGIDFINEGDNNTNVQKALAWAKSGGIVTAMWHQGAPSIGEGYDNSKKKIVIDSCFIPGTKAYIDYWAGLKKKADWLQKLRDAHVPVLWRPYHELNGGWFWWSMQGPDKFKQLWDTMFNYFVYKRGLNNLIWVLCYSGNIDGSWNPGRQYVDIAGGDTYGVGTSIQLGMFNASKKLFSNDTIPIVYHECGVPPDPDQCLLQGAMWSWWMEWHTDYIFGVDTAYLRKVYNHNLIVTLDKVPNILAQYGWNEDSCKASAISPQIKIDNGAWRQTNTMQLGLGTNVTFYPQVSDSGIWSWSGLGLSSALKQQIVSINKTGIATAVFKNYCGATSTQTFNIVECTPTTINPYLQTKGGTLENNKNVIINKGISVTLSPNPETGGSWSWSGCGTMGTSRVQTITPDTTCTATVEYTNECGKTSTLDFKIQVENIISVKLVSSENSDVIIYPILCNESLNIELLKLNGNTSSVVNIYTIQGTLVLSKNTDLKNILLNTSALKPGMYILKIQNNDFKISKRFIKL